MNLMTKIFWKRHCLKSIAAGVLVIVLTGIPSMSSAATISEEEAFAIGTEAYIYGYPLVTMEMTRRVMTNVEKPEGTRAPMGQLVRMREYPTAAFRDVTAPNADTLYTTAWLDVGKEPWVLSLPDAHGRYYLFPMLDTWTNVFQVPGKRTTGTGLQKYAITGPGWTGKLARGRHRIQIAHRPALDSGPHLLHWHSGRLLGRACHAGRDLPGSTQLIRQDIYAASRKGGPQHRHEDRGPRPGQCPRHGGLL